MGDALERFPDGRHGATERLDDGHEIAVCVTVTGRRAVVDFTGTSDVHPGNLNATPAVVTGAVIYVLRLMVEEALPLNEGLMDAVELWLLAENLGSVESLVTHPVTMTHADVDEAERHRVGISDGLVRLSVGLEDVEDLTDDLARALDQA